MYFKAGQGKSGRSKALKAYPGYIRVYGALIFLCLCAVDRLELPCYAPYIALLIGEEL